MELTIDEALKKGVEAHKLQQIQEADKLYTAILQVQPKHPDANHNMGVLAVGVGKVQEALPFFKTALEARSSIAQYWLSYIDALIKLGQIADAKAVFSQAKSKGASSETFDQLGTELSKLSTNPQDPPSDLLQPIINLYQQGQLQQALDSTKQLLKQFPNSFPLYNIQGAANAGLGQFNAAIDSWKQALKIKPDSAEAYSNMGAALKDKGDLDASIDSCKKALKIKPDYAEAYSNMGNALQGKGDLDASIDSYKQALKIKPDYAAAYSNMGIVLKDKGDLDASIDSYKQALKIKPDHAEAYSNICEAYEKSNQLAELNEIISIAKTKLTKLPDHLLFYEAIYNFRLNHHEECGKLIALVDIDQLDPTRTALFWQLKAKFEHQQKDYKSAFNSFAAMNSSVINSSKYKGNEAQKYFDELLNQLQQLHSIVDTPYSQGLAEPSADTPTFLIGFPRSGTTLLDTILRTHSNIEVIEEQSMVSKAHHHLGNQLSIVDIENLTAEELTKARVVYFKELSKHVSTKNSDCVIDKFPLNILDVPFIHKLFPTAKFILALRHPLDSIFSCWMQSFKLNTSMANMVELDRIVDFYGLAMTVLELSEKRYSLNIHSIRYEDLVLDMKSEVSNLLGFLELDWENALEDYQTTALRRGIINTPSYSQVVQPIYKTASYRWKKYSEPLEKYFVKIEKWTTKFGYEL